MAGVLVGNSVCYHDQHSVRVFGGGPILALTSSKERVVELDIVTHSCDLRLGAVASTRCEPNWQCVPWAGTFGCSFMSVMEPSIACYQQLRPEAEGKDPRWSLCLDRRRVVCSLFALVTESKSSCVKRRRESPFRTIGRRGSHHL